VPHGLDSKTWFLSKIFGGSWVSLVLTRCEMNKVIH